MTKTAAPSPKMSAPRPAARKAPARRARGMRARLARAAALFTHVMFALVIVLAFVHGGKPRATVKLETIGEQPKATAPNDASGTPRPKTQEAREPHASPPPAPSATMPPAQIPSPQVPSPEVPSPQIPSREVPSTTAALPADGEPAGRAPNHTPPAADEAPKRGFIPSDRQDSATPPAAAPEENEAFEVAARARRQRQEPSREPPAQTPARPETPAAPQTPAPIASAPRAPSALARANRLMDRLVAVYPDHLASHDGNNLIWRDGSRTPFDDGIEKSAQDRLARPDVEDQFALSYPLGEMLSDPEPDFDPGRVRDTAFFTKMYGDCRKSRDMQRRMVDVVWLPRSGGGRKIKATPVNGVAEKLQRVSDELDALGPDVAKFLRPVGATFVCRDAANTSRWAAHGFGIAIDIAQGDHWESGRPRRGAAAPETVTYRNRIPPEIVAVFEKHGFIWGGKWYHFDTAHFEYRPELLVPDPAGEGDTAVPMPVKQPRDLD